MDIIFIDYVLYLLGSLLMYLIFSFEFYILKSLFLILYFN